MKKILSLLLILMLGLCLLAACANDKQFAPDESGAVESESGDQEQVQLPGQVEDEDETAEVKTKKVEDSFFVGSWVGNSEKAKHMYGNVNITINEDGTWDGNITEEEIHGTWTHNGDGIRLSSDVIPFNMIYSSNNNVLLQEVDDTVRVVLTRE